MKRIIFLLLSCAYVNQALASVSIVNENEINYIEASYQFCREDKKTREYICTSVETINVEAGQNHLANISVPANMETFIIVKAVEKDLLGNVIAEGKYETIKGFSHCGYPLYHYNMGINAVISLSDLKKTPIIRCLASGY